MTRPSVYTDLPEALFELVPELDAVALDPEPLADCSRCVRVAAHHGGDPERPWAFEPNLRCCTFSPNLPNVLVGRALRRGGRGAEVVRARIAERRDMTAWGLFPGKAYDEAYVANQSRFGRVAELRCPFWADGDLACGIWPDRPAVCRTWHCRHTRGERGLDQWQRVRVVIERTLDHVAVAAVAAGRPPLDTDPTPAWEAWFVWCADWADERAGGLGDLLRDEVVEQAVVWMTAGAGAPATIPDVVVPALARWDPDGGRLYLTSYSLYDGVYAPKTVFAFLSRLDGTVPWREALAAANATLDEPLPESLVHDLFRIGALRSPTDTDLPDEPAVPVPR